MMNLQQDDWFPPEKNEKPSMVWMLSFADLLSLLLAFFVMLYAMNQTELSKWQEAVKSLQQRLNPARATASFSLSSKEGVPQETTVRGLDLGYLVPIARTKLAAAQLPEVSVLHSGDRVILSLPGDMLFAASDIRLTDKAKSSVLALADVLGSLDNRVEIVGHAEPGKPTNAAYPTGWELSLSRAAAVAKALQESGYERDLPIVGLADTRYADLDPSLPEETRRALARRVDLVLQPQRSGE